MSTIHDIRKAKKFLTYEQETSLIDVLTYKLQGPMKRKLRDAIRYHFISLGYREYWKEFEVKIGGVAYAGKNLKKVRTDILEQVGND